MYHYHTMTCHTITLWYVSIKHRVPLLYCALWLKICVFDIYKEHCQPITGSQRHFHYQTVTGIHCHNAICITITLWHAILSYIFISLALNILLAVSGICHCHMYDFTMRCITMITMTWITSLPQSSMWYWNPSLLYWKKLADKLF